MCVNRALPRGSIGTLHGLDPINLNSKNLFPTKDKDLDLDKRFVPVLTFIQAGGLPRGS